MEKIQVFKIVAKKKGKAEVIRYSEKSTFAYKLLDKYDRKGYNVIIKKVWIQI